MDNEIIIIDQAYKYEVNEILNGGVGYVRLMSMLELSRKPPYPVNNTNLDCAGGQSKYPYRNQLAAKTLKNPEEMKRFSTACESWLELSLRGVVPLLKLIENGEETLALMPRYSGNLLKLIQSGNYEPVELLNALYPVVACLSEIYTKYGIVHQAIKPENILYCSQNQKLVFELSDWGIAKVQADLLPSSKEERFRTIEDFGVLPYLAPERFDSYIADFRADIFSLGMVCFEIVTGELPYVPEKSMAEQIISGDYFGRAQSILFIFSAGKITSLILKMIEPSGDKRLQEFGEFLALIKSL